MTRAGHRRIIPILGGVINGTLDAEILAGGWDHQTVTAAGTLEIDSRYAARTSDGSRVEIHARGVRTGALEVLAALARGDSVSPSEYYFRTSLRFETSSPLLSHLERHLFIASASRRADGVHYTAYKVS